MAQKTTKPTAPADPAHVPPTVTDPLTAPTPSETSPLLRWDEPDIEVASASGERGLTGEGERGVSGSVKKAYSRIPRLVVAATLVFGTLFLLFAILSLPIHPRRAPLADSTTSIPVLPATGARIMAYNFYLRPPPVQLHGDYKNDRLDIFINTHLDNYDIFALTETFGTLTSRRERLLDAAAARGIKYWAHGPERNWWKGKFVDSGLLVMSRFPIMVIDSVEYGIGLGPDAVAAKGIVYAQINVADKEHNVHKVHLFVSHLQATYIPDEDGNDLTTDTTVLRHAQFQFFRTYLSTTLSTNHYNSSLDTVLLAGDFNTPGAPFGWLPHEDSAEYTRMLLTLSTGGAKVTDVYRQRYGEQKPTWKPWKVVLGEEEERKEEDPQSWGKRLDYLLQWEGGVKQGGRTRLRLGVDQTALQPFKVEGTPFAQLSDHSAVTSVLNFTD